MSLQPLREIRIAKRLGRAIYDPVANARLLVACDTASERRDNFSSTATMLRCNGVQPFTLWKKPCLGLLTKLPCMSLCISLVRRSGLTYPENSFSKLLRLMHFPDSSCGILERIWRRRGGPIARVWPHERRR